MKPESSSLESLPLSLLNDYLYCPRGMERSGNRIVGRSNICYPLRHDD